MRAILIDPYTRTVTEIENDGTLDGLYKAIQCEMVEAIRVGNNETMWLDEEGFLSEGRPVFRLGDNAQALAGRAVILGDKDGESTPTKLAVAAVAAAVKWTDLESTGDFHEGGVAEGGDGEGYDFIIRGGTPMLRKRKEQTD
jgi:hypothetical protein